MAQELKIVISAVGKGIKRTTNSLIQGLNKGTKSLKVFNAAATGGQKVSSGLASQIKGLIGAYAGFSALSKSVEMVKNSETAIYNLESSVKAANREFKDTGSVEDWEESVSRLSDELVIYSNTALRNAISRTVDMTKRLGLSKDQMEEVIKRSADLGAGKTDLEGAIERVTSALRGEAEASEYLGLTLNENYVKSWYEANKQTEKAWKDLTDIEKAQVRYQVLLEQSNELQGRAAGSAQTFAGAVQLVRKEIENAVTNNQDVVETMNQVAASLRENAGEIGLFVSQLISGAANVAEFAVKYKEMLLVLVGATVAVSVVSKLVAVINALNAAFVVLTGMNIAAWFASLRVAIAGAAASTAALGIAFKGFVALAAAQGVINIVKATKAFFDMRDAQHEARESLERLYETTDRVMKKYDEFKDVKLPDDITGTAPEELDELSRNLKRARAYWVALQAKLQSKAGETTMFGTATKEAIAAQGQLKKVNRRINQINSDLKKVEEGGRDAAKGLEAPTEAVKATSEQLDKFQEQAKKAYDYAISQAEKYAKEVISWEEKIKYARMSTEDKIRELGRKSLSDEEQWADEKRQADEKLYAAKQALRQKDYELAEKLAKDAESLYAGLAEEVKGSDSSGNEVVKQSLEDSKKVAISGVETVGNFIQDLYSKQKENAKESQTQWETTASKIQAQLDNIAKERAANVKIELKGLESAQNRINALVKNETKYITVVTRTVSENQAGGPILAASAGAFVRRAGRLGGYGGGDRIKSLLEAGEFIIRKEAVAKYGASFFSALNSMRLNLPDVQGAVRARIGGLISSLPVSGVKVPAFAAGGGVGSPSETLLVRFQAGDVEAPVRISDPSSRAAMKKMAREMSRMRLTYGK
nr:phage tail tape measure protein [uncultured Desulfobacter sp.]